MKGMNMNLKNFLSLAGLFCGSFAATSAHAYSDASNDTTTTTNYSQITPPAGFAAAPGVGFSLYADFIYWEARQANIDYAVSGVGDNIAAQGQVYYPKFDYQPGFKAGMAVDMGHDNWDLDANYTWLNTCGGKTSASTSYDNPILAPTRTLFTADIIPLEEYVLTEADGDWKFVYNLANINLGRNYYISEYLTLRPFFGISGAWNHQNQAIHYTYTVEDPLHFIAQHYKQSYWGVGFETGLNTAWCFDENWSIYGDFNVMNLWSKYEVKENEIYYLFDDGDVDYAEGTVAYNTIGTQYGIQNIVDIQMGLRWAMRFDDNTMGFSVQVGWDQQVWINHAQYATKASNLSVQGLDVRARFDF